jgi:hypothetical protein
MFTLDDIQVYILNWKKVNENSLRLYQSIQPIVNHTYIVNCDEHWSLDASIQHIQLDDSCYYGAQFHTAIQHVRGNAILCVIVGDNLPENDFATLFASALAAFNMGRIGIYAPKDKRSNHQKLLRKYTGSLYHVKNTDCGFWFIHPAIQSKMKRLDYTISKYGWAIDMVMIKEAKRLDMLVLCDQSVETDQLDHTCGYNMIDAAKEGTALLRSYTIHTKSRVMPFFRR